MTTSPHLPLQWPQGSQLQVRVDRWDGGRLTLGRRNWLFVGSALAGERAAMIMCLLQSAKLNKADPWAYLKDLLTRLPTQLNSRIDELHPHRWKPAT